MPEVRFTVRWPDGSSRLCYSPSTIIHDYLVAGEAVPLAAFVERARDGLSAASARVALRYGQSCSIATREIGEIEAIASRQPADGAVTVEFVG